MSRRPPLTALAVSWHVDADGTVRLGSARIARMPRYHELLLEHLRRTPRRDGVRQITIEHEDGCAHWRGRACNCEPQIIERDP
jgi:hypothetical protein